MRRSNWASRVALSSVAALLALAPARAAGAPSLAGVHWYSGDSSMLDLSVPAGERGFNVEVIFDTGWCDGDPSTDPGDVRSVAATAKAHGLVNIVRVDYHQQQAVPTSSGEYASWATGFIKCTQELGDLASLFVVGNEPNIEDGGRPEGDIRGDEYASAFNYLYSRKAEMPSGTQLLATFNSPFTPPGWMLDMSSRLSGVDGFVLHTGGVRASCRDPRQACSYGGWPFDGAFRYYRDVIGSIHSSWWSRPVYITEFNTYTGDVGSEPDVNYPADWINQAFEEIRSYNAGRGSRPAVKALCWFVDRPQSWPRFSLRNIGAARTDMSEEFRNPANRGAGGACPNDALATLDRSLEARDLEQQGPRGRHGRAAVRRGRGDGGFSFDWGERAAQQLRRERQLRGALQPPGLLPDERHLHLHRDDRRRRAALRRRQHGHRRLAGHGAHGAHGHRLPHGRVARPADGLLRERGRGGGDAELDGGWHSLRERGPQRGGLGGEQQSTPRPTGATRRTTGPSPSPASGRATERPATRGSRWTSAAATTSPSSSSSTRAARGS